MFPSSVQPPVLAWVFTDELLDGFCVFSGNPFYGVIFVFPFVWHNQPVYLDIEEEAVGNPSAETDSDGDIVRCRQQADTFVGAGLSAEKIDEYAFSPCVLVGYEAERSAAAAFLHHQFRGAFFVDYFLAHTFANAVQVFIDELVVERPGDTVNVEAE